MATIGTKQAAERLGITQSAVARLCREGRLKGAEQDKKGSPWHIPEESVNNYRSELFFTTIPFGKIKAAALLQRLISTRGQ